MSKLWSDIVAMVTAPFTQKLDLLNLFVLVGIVLIFIAGWVLILNHVRIAAAEAV